MRKELHILNIMYESSFISDGNYLMHHGIKGQKWGVRRFQNEDGTWTDAGKRRRDKYRTDDGELTRSGKRAYKRELRKLNKLKNRADLSLQQKNLEKYNSRSKKLGKAALIGAGVTGAAVAGRAIMRNRDKLKRLDLISKMADKSEDLNLIAAAKRHNDKIFNGKGTRSIIKEAIGVNNAQLKSDFMKTAIDLNSARKDFDKHEISTRVHNTRANAIVGTAGVATAGLTGAAIYSKLKARSASKNIKDIQSGEAQKRYKEQLERMNQMFGSTKVSDLNRNDADYYRKHKKNYG